MIVITALVTICLVLAALALAVLRPQPRHPVNQWFCCLAFAVAAWAAALAFAHGGISPTIAVRAAFGAASIIPIACVGLAHAFDVVGRPSSRIFLVMVAFAGAVVTGISIFSSLVVSTASVIEYRVSRELGGLYPVFAVYFLVSFSVAGVLFVYKLKRSRGLARVQLQYLAAGVIFSGAGGMIANLLLPIVSGRSTYSWVGPCFGLLLAAVIAHAIIRHRLMDLRFVVHRAVTHGLAVLVSLLPLGLLLGAVRWLHNDQQDGEHSILIVTAIVGGLLAPYTRDFALDLADRYTFRTSTNYRHTVRNTSEALTRVLSLDWILSLISRTVKQSVGPESIAFYVLGESRMLLARTQGEVLDDAAQIPREFPDLVMKELAYQKTCVVTEEVKPQVLGDPGRQLHDELTRLNWALVLPLLSEDSVIGAIVVGPKLSGDPFYPHDIDLLMTLANQAGIAVKNAQLYTEVVLANEYIENIVATIESGVVAINAAGQVTRFNRAAAQLTGVVGEDVIGRSVEALPGVLAGLVRTTLADGQARTEPEVALPDGTTTRPVICTTSSLRDPAGGVLGAVAVFSDLTPLKQLEAERLRVERLAYFEILASSIAHEIKNPLVAIKTFAQLIPRRHQDGQFVDEFSRVVTREIVRMERLVERLRTLARPSDRPKQRLDLRAPVRDAVEFLRPVFEEKRIALGLSLGEEPRPVIGDAGELESLFLNLLMNACEATPPDGAVAIDLTTGTDQFLVTVADSGPGIPPDLVEHVFDPFITTKLRGSGLGLSICAGIAAAHRAKLRAANRPAGGAVFTIEFLIAVPTEAALAHEDHPAGHSR